MKNVFTVLMAGRSVWDNTALRALYAPSVCLGYTTAVDHQCIKASAAVYRSNRPSTAKLLCNTLFECVL